MVAKLEDNLDEAGIADDQYVGLVVPHDYAWVCTVQDYLVVLAVPVDFRSLGTELLASSFLVNTEIGEDMDPFYRLHVVACEEAVDRDILAWEVVHCSVGQDSSFGLLMVCPDLNPD